MPCILAKFSSAVAKSGSFKPVIVTDWCIYLPASGSLLSLLVFCLVTMIKCLLWDT